METLQENNSVYEAEEMDMAIQVLSTMLRNSRSTLGKAVRLKHPSVKHWTGYTKALIASLKTLTEIQDYFESLEGETKPMEGHARGTVDFDNPPRRSSAVDPNKIDSPWA